MIDTLKLSKRLTAAHMPQEQADALAEGLAESLKESYVTREFLDSRLSALETRLTLRIGAMTTAAVAVLIGVKFFA
jgi:hypothetical protein